MIISTIKHAVQTHETQQMAPVNRSESLFSVRIPRSKVHATRDTLRLPRKPIETLTRDTRRARVQCTKNRTEERERERERNEGNRFRGGTAVLDIEHTAVCASTSGRDRAPRGGAVDSCELLKLEKSVESVGVDTFCTRSGGGNIVDDNILTFASPPAL